MLLRGILTARLTRYASMDGDVLTTRVATAFRSREAHRLEAIFESERTGDCYARRCLA